MTLDRNSTRDIVCVAGGTGLAPIKALIEELTRYNRTRWVHVFFGARDRDDLYDLAALSRLAARYPWLSVVPACSEDPSYFGEQGNISEVVARYGPWDDARLLRLRLDRRWSRARCGRSPSSRCRRSASNTTRSATHAQTCPGPPGAACSRALVRPRGGFPASPRSVVPGPPGLSYCATGTSGAPAGIRSS